MFDKKPFTGSSLVGVIKSNIYTL